MPDNPQRFNTLFQLYLNNSITSTEYAELLALLNNETASNELTAELKKLWIQSGREPIGPPASDWDEKMAYLIKQLGASEDAVITVKRIRPWFRFIWAAALFLLIASTSTYFLIWNKKSSSSPQPAVAKTDTAKGILPGGNKAVLVLADGTTIVLDSSSNGELASQGSAKIIKLNSGQLVYNSGDARPSAALYNTLSTPVGGQYQVTLADGTVVWLNSGSSLRYPTVFKGRERKVEITGEAYFEVAKNRKQPFKVAIKLASGDGGEVEVLGTHFNINAYDDEATVRTTLLEGSVNVNKLGKTVQIKPGQQVASASAGPMQVVNDADVEEVVAWKEGRFQFENTPVKDVMRQLARWYGLQVEYNGVVSGHFEGTISRNVNVLKVLDMLELTGEVRFKMEGTKLTVSPQSNEIIQLK